MRWRPDARENELSSVEFLPVRDSHPLTRVRQQIYRQFVTALCLSLAHYERSRPLSTNNAQ